MASGRHDEKLYEEMSQLNNELVNLQRGLAQRNAELANLTRELDLRVARRTHELQTANEELETLAYAMAHELRSPCRHVDAFGELLENSTAVVLPPRERGWVAVMRASARRQSAMVEAFLLYLRLGSATLRRECVSMDAEAELAVAQVEKHAPIEWTIGPLPPAFCDRALVREILRQLVGNAAKFSGAQPHTSIEIGATREAGQVVYFVRDNGAGFDPERAGNMFRPFERMHTQAEYPGLGIGLAIVKRLVARHDGQVWAESNPLGGATFHFTLGQGSDDGA